MDFTTNITSQKKEKANKKPIRSIEKITNTQTVNPAFNFQWNSEKKSITGKVFARKRKMPIDKQTQDKKTLNVPKIKQNVVQENKVPPKEKAQNNNKPEMKTTNIKNYTEVNNIDNKNKTRVINNNMNKSEAMKNSGAKFQKVDKEFINAENHSEGKNDHIKRKQKKDKILAKTQNLELKPAPSEQKSYSLFDNRTKNIYVDTSGGGKSVSEKVFLGGSFKDFGIHTHLVSNLEKIDFVKSTNVQGKAIPVVLSGKNTLIRSQTGSGKTLAYAVPIIDALQGLSPRLKRTDGVQAIIVVPTRELALQTHELFSKINTFQWVVVGHLCGGENRKSEKERIRKGINVLIGTPGRLLDHVLHTTALSVDKVRCLVLDEADRLLDMGFRKDIVGLVEALDQAKTNSEYDPMSLIKKGKNREASTKTDEQSDLAPLRNPHSKIRQTVLLSATLNKGVSELAEFTMKEHVYIDALDHTSNAILGSYILPDTIKQEFIMTYPKHRLFTLSALLAAQSKEPTSKLFVFMASTQMVEFHYDLFTKCLLKMPSKHNKVNTVPVFEDESESDDDEDVVLNTEFFKLHGSMDQKMRKEVFNGFRAATKGILICTDVAARGIDVPAADCIIQYTGPQTDEDYLHRVGRTGRAGKSGSAIIFLTHEEQAYITHLREHRVFLKKNDPEKYLEYLRELLGYSDAEQAATALQKRYEAAVYKDDDLYKSACFAYSTWSRYYNSYPAKLRTIFNFKNANLGHYVTSFALRDTPTNVAKVVRGQVANIETPRLNKKLANHQDNKELLRPRVNKKKPRSLSLSTSEFSSGLEPIKKKKKKI